MPWDLEMLTLPQVQAFIRARQRLAFPWIGGGGGGGGRSLSPPGRWRKVSVDEAERLSRSRRKCVGDG